MNILDILYDVGKHIHSSTLTEKTLFFIFESISKNFNLPNILLAIYDNNSKKFVTQFISGFNENESQKIILSELDIMPSFFSVTQIQLPIEPISYFKNIPSSENINIFSNIEVTNIIRKYKFNNYFFMPMINLNKISGVIIAFTHSKLNFDTETLKNLSILVQVAAIISDNINLKQIENQKTSKMATLYEISQQTKNILDPTDALSSLVDIIKGLIHYDMCTLYTVNYLKKELKLKKHIGIEPPILGEDSVSLDKLPPIILELLQTKSAILTHFGIYKSFLAIPVIIAEKLVAIVLIGSYKSYAYTEDDKLAVKILASQVASIDNLFLTLLNMRTYTESILECMPIGFLTVDMTGNINLINQTAKAYLNLLNYSNNEIIGKSYLEILENNTQIINILKDTLAKGLILENFEIQTNNKLTKTKQSLEVTIFPFKNSEGIRLGIAMFLRDISKIRQMEEHIRRTDRLSALGELASGVAHEIRNPLTGIKMMIQIINKELEKNNIQSIYAKAIQDEITRLDNIISNLLNFAKPSKPEFSNVKIVDILESTLFLLDSKIKKENITVIREYSSDNITAYCDNNQMKQVFFNIIQNAIQAMTNSLTKIIKISVLDDDTHCLIKISDTGCGIPRDAFEQIFNPFYTTKDRGTGLGLAIVHRILEEHNGSISLESEIDHGTIFYVKIPKIKNELKH